MTQILQQFKDNKKHSNRIRWHDLQSNNTKVADINNNKALTSKHTTYLYTRQRDADEELLSFVTKSFKRSLTLCPLRRQSLEQSFLKLALNNT